MKVVVCSGGFDPIHRGHIRMFEEAKKLGDHLVVAVNSDEWLTRKKGRPFMPLLERVSVVYNLRMVDEVLYDFDDSDGSCKDALVKIKAKYPSAEVIFANGGDRTATNIPEMEVKNVLFKFGIGGEDKANSSSWILQEWKAPKTERPWGYYRVLHEVQPSVKLKELTVLPGQRLSMQRHKQREEFWFVAEGVATVYTPDSTLLGKYEKFDTLHIAIEQWHQLANETEVPLKLIEIQYGAACVEEDIERINTYS